MSTALNTQIDGSHYKKMPMQPLELAYMLGATPCFTKLAKYATRDKGDQVINIDKAIHVIGIEKELHQKAPYMLIQHYPGINDNSRHELANILINIYTPEILIQEALKAMFSRDYDRAIDRMQKYKRQIQ